MTFEVTRPTLGVLKMKIQLVSGGTHGVCATEMKSQGIQDPLVDLKIHLAKQTYSVEPHKILSQKS